MNPEPPDKKRPAPPQKTELRLSQETEPPNPQPKRPARKSEPPSRPPLILTGNTAPEKSPARSKKDAAAKGPTVNIGMGEGGFPRSPIAAILVSAIGRMDSVAKVRESLAMAYWPRVVGAQAAAATEVEDARDGILFVRTKSSVWSHELTLHKERLLTGLNRMLGGKTITDIVYRARGVKKKESAPPEPDTPPLDELNQVILEPPEQAELRAHLESLVTIKEERIRNVIAARMTQEAKLRHWRLAHGWKSCPRCAFPHKTAFDLCPKCRLER
jgi:predicted nucleic acid-binding Zn ribbon protein